MKLSCARAGLWVRWEATLYRRDGQMVSLSVQMTIARLVYPRWHGGGGVCLGTHATGARYGWWERKHVRLPQ